MLQKLWKWNKDTEYYLNKFLFDPFFTFKKYSIRNRLKKSASNLYMNRFMKKRNKKCSKMTSKLIKRDKNLPDKVNKRNLESANCRFDKTLPEKFTKKCFK